MSGDDGMSRQDRIDIALILVGVVLLGVLCAWSEGWL
jgi:hypothetical protein